jgi:single-strand selective monofunctional uracil DNA glycosylase
LSEKCTALSFSEPVAFVYNPLVYARRPHERYLSLYGQGKKKVLLVGMNPGPWGMAQTGVPFGEISAVRQWMGIHAGVDQPAFLHPKRPVQGFACTRSEVSGRRLWALMQDRFGSAEAFFREHFVTNYCPLIFYEQGGRNRTPDKLKVQERRPLFAACDEYLTVVIEILQPQWIIGVGRFTEDRIRAVERQVNGHPLRIARILHPSPANPRANQGWAEQVERTLQNLGVWSASPERD